MKDAQKQKELTALREKAQQLLAADHFKALGLAQTASADDVRRAFILAAKTWHPDRAPQESPSTAGGASGKTEDIRALFGRVFARLDLARVTLSDPGRRTRYIQELTGGGSERQASSAEISSAEAGLEFRKAEALLKKNDTTQAEQHLRRAVQLAPTNVEFQALLISLQAQKPQTTPEDLARLATDLDRLIAKDPQCERAYVHRGQIRKRLDRLADAHADFVRAVALNPSNVDAAREVRIYEMRHGKTPAPEAKAKAGGKSAKEEGGFFRKLFKR